MATVGFDFGTSNCALGIMHLQQPTLIELGEHGRYIPSSLYSASRDTIVNWLHQQLPAEQQTEFAQQRRPALQKGQRELAELKLDGLDPNLSFGLQALKRYLEDPQEGYYIKSPKSFLGASGLVKPQIELFEDLVAAMMSHLKSCAESRITQSLDNVVIGKPVNFQGLKGDESNRQALEILTKAAKRVGFKQVEFQYEPVAAGVEFEASLTSQKKVLVVDIGGGTSDCSMLLMGPNFVNQLDRSQHILSHSGQRIGGNDFDIQLSLHGLMPQFGLNEIFKTGKPMPRKAFSDAVEINNIVAQTYFYSAENARYLAQLGRDAAAPQIIARLQAVQKQKLSHQLVNLAELAKIELTEHDKHSVDLSFIETDLFETLSQDDLAQANQRNLTAVGELINEAILQAGCQPDIVFVTGGSAKSPVLSQYIQSQCPAETELVIGDYFGSVASGLTRWAERIYTL
ncbi:molecular chaperone [Catenovulum sp. 2E275]|uniref:molecular chaperone n=1 Tax=Catenovulum sp. 2E275 TaxID=2980497 RepID=UPI0021D04A4C|nr:molecular chaperone [Catenovulum sp. 2E275]MCU4675670.1 molecular chaperone [Catenovulum sp. 2E275]